MSRRKADVGRPRTPPSHRLEPARSPLPANRYQALAALGTLTLPMVDQIGQFEQQWVLPSPPLTQNPLLLHLRLLKLHNLLRHTILIGLLSEVPTFDSATGLQGSTKPLIAATLSTGASMATSLTLVLHKELSQEVGTDTGRADDVGDASNMLMWRRDGQDRWCRHDTRVKRAMQGRAGWTIRTLTQGICSGNVGDADVDVAPASPSPTLPAPASPGYGRGRCRQDDVGEDDVGADDVDGRRGHRQAKWATWMGDTGDVDVDEAGDAVTWARLVTR
ncbi:uncharacterized protein BXZ73DRAFT_73576 [Epithele typhae]|uniref:uncharacterized protein n=1 Tax=Epithele typhae TaxID=378194 RepID=UPI002007F10A|nr:uncharacterized protein BXZ73DRAFT_73576 [Epithele typhae]KAH9945430.1 hypothetical protein BXZ73DRAFT_73576 [Epithele typhae]